MSSALFILDTNVLSEFQKRPNRQILSWLNSLTGVVAIPFGAVIEIQRGIEKIARQDKVRSEILQEWLRSLIEADIPFISMDASTAQLYAKMTMVPALKDLWVPAAHSKEPKLGQDLTIAAAAITSGTPIATLNTKDFLRIHRHFHLPGLYDPLKATWSIELENHDTRQFALTY